MIMIKTLTKTAIFSTSTHFGYYFLFSLLRFKHTEIKVTLTDPIKFSPKKVVVQEQLHEIYTFPCPIFNSFIQPSPPITVKLKFLHDALRAQLPPQKQFRPFLACPHHMTTSKSPPTYMLFKQSFPLLQDLPGKPDRQAIHCPTANFVPLSRGCITLPIIITVLDTYLTPRSPGAWV